MPGPQLLTYLLRLEETRVTPPPGYSPLPVRFESMAPKKAAAPQPEPEPVFDPHAPLPPLLQAFVDDAATEMCARLADDIVDESFARAYYTSELDRRSGTQEVDYEMVQIVRAMRWYFIANDKGSDLRAPSWAADKEPVPAVRDTWSRGTCKGRPKKAPSRPASATYILSSSNSYSGNRARPGSAGGDRSRRSPSRPGSAASAPGGLSSVRVRVRVSDPSPSPSPSPSPIPSPNPNPNPNPNPQPGTLCFVSGKPAKCWVLWGRSY